MSAFHGMKTTSASVCAQAGNLFAGLFSGSGGPGDGIDRVPNPRPLSVDSPGRPAACAQRAGQGRPLWRRRRMREAVAAPPATAARRGRGRHAVAMPPARPPAGASRSAFIAGADRGAAPLPDKHDSAQSNSAAAGTHSCLFAGVTAMWTAHRLPPALRPAAVLEALAPGPSGLRLAALAPPCGGRTHGRVHTNRRQRRRDPQQNRLPGRAGAASVTKALSRSVTGALAGQRESERKIA